MDEVSKKQNKFNILKNGIKNNRNKIGLTSFLILFISLLSTLYFVNVYSANKKLSLNASAQVSGVTGSLQMIGHTSLKNRGMNSALAIYKNYVYVGSRTDGSHPDTEVMIVDKTDPANLKIVGKILSPPPTNGYTSRELRVWPEKNVLVVLYFGCSSFLHSCKETSKPAQYRFFDISGQNATDPKLITIFNSNTHEFFLWDDPFNAGRALIFASTIGGMQIIDISKVRHQVVKQLYYWPTYAGGGLHSLSISTNGKRAYIANLSGGFFILDTSDFANNISDPSVRLVTDPNKRVKFGFYGPHSAVKVPGRNLVIATEEVYGTVVHHGCPWGWMRVIDISNQLAPSLIGEYKINQNKDSFCTDLDPKRNKFSSFSTHNPTVTPHLAIVSWHSGGLRVISLDNPNNPVELAKFIPTPLSKVSTEDPMLSSGVDKVVFWSYPVISNGVIYVVDIRNGLYALKYTGPYQDEIDNTKFLESNSKLGNAVSFEDPRAGMFELPSDIAYPKTTELIIHNHDTHD